MCVDSVGVFCQCNCQSLVFYLSVYLSVESLFIVCVLTHSVHIFCVFISAELYLSVEFLTFC